MEYRFLRNIFQQKTLPNQLKSLFSGNARRSAGILGSSALAMFASNLAYKSYSEEAGSYVFGWGSSKKGQLGQGHENIAVVGPTGIKDLEGMNFKSMTAGGEMSAAINDDGELFTWGSAKNGAQVNARGQTYPSNLLLPTFFASEEHLFS
jgi:hypothetical protein